MNQFEDGAFVLTMAVVNCCCCCCCCSIDVVCCLFSSFDNVVEKLLMFNAMLFVIVLLYGLIQSKTYSLLLYGLIQSTLYGSIHKQKATLYGSVC